MREVNQSTQSRQIWMEAPDKIKVEFPIPDQSPDYERYKEFLLAIKYTIESYSTRDVIFKIEYAELLPRA